MNASVNTTTWKGNGGRLEANARTKGTAYPVELSGYYVLHELKVLPYTSPFCPCYNEFQQIYGPLWLDSHLAGRGKVSSKLEGNNMEGKVKTALTTFHQKEPPQLSWFAYDLFSFSSRTKCCSQSHFCSYFFLLSHAVHSPNPHAFFLFHPKACNSFPCAIRPLHIKIPPVNMLL